MDEATVTRIAQMVYSQNLSSGQFGPTQTTYHKHNGTDSLRFPFLNLADVPVSYYTEEGRSVVVNTTETGLTFGGKLGNTGPLFDHFVSVGNVTTAETDLYSDTIAASTLATNGDNLEAEYGGVFVSSGTATREVKIYFGGTVIFDTGTLTLSLSSAWTVYVTIIRVSATVVRYMISFTTEGAALAAYTAVGEVTGLALSNANILKITGQAAGAGAATNDIVAMMGTVLLISAA